jgi:Zn-dependent protease with chaperone function
MTAIANNLVVSFHYTLTNAEGETLDQSQGEPLAYLHGAGGSSFLSTHPSNSQRIDAMRKNLPAAQQIYNQRR